MSTLNVANITDGTTTVGTSYVVNGSAKAWVNFDGTGTVAIRDNLNVSSLTDNGTGNYTANFSNSMSDGNYACLTTSGNNVGAGYGAWSVPASVALSTASSVRLYGYTSGGSFQDQDQYMSALFGDLA